MSARMPSASLAEPLSHFGERALQQRDLGPIFQVLVAPLRAFIPSEHFAPARTEGAVEEPAVSLSARLPTPPVFIERNQMSRCAEAFCDFVTVPAQAHRGVDISPATPHV